MMLFPWGMFQCSFSRFYGYVMVKWTLLLILTHHNFNTLKKYLFHCYDEQNSDLYSYLKWSSYYTHCIHTVNMKSSCQSFCSRNLVLLAWQKLCMHLRSICILLKLSLVSWLKYFSIYILYILTVQLVIRYFSDFDSQNFEVALRLVSNLMESPKVLAKSVF